MAGEGLGDDREFRHPFPWWQCALLASVVVVPALLAMALPWPAGIPRSHRSAAVAAAWIALLPIAAVAGYCYFRLLAWVVLLRRLTFAVTKAGIAVTDTHGQSQRMPWDEVKELRTWRKATRIGHMPRALEMVFPLMDGIEGERVLRDIVIDRAGLTRVERKWWGEMWTRPPEAEAHA